MIPRQVIDEIKYRSDIVQVISEYVSLKRAGSNMTGLCPFHSEKSPSFTVFTGTTSFYCFGCQAGGDVVSFIMRAENLDYVDALKYLANKFGVDVPEEETYVKRADTVPRERIFALNKDAAHFFVSKLSESNEAKEYIKKRGLGDGLVKHFGIGFAPNDFTALTSAMLAKGYTEKELETAFLSKRSEKNGKLYDIFRNRVMFPVIDVTGNVIAFGGRILTDEKPKYINTSDTPVFNKSRHLFALNFAKQHCAEKMILCEGYMDVVSLHGAGFANAIATCGTSITQEQARLMKRYTKHVIISYDADAAGQNAADRAFELLGDVGLDCRLLKVENAKDPDEFIKKFGSIAFNNLLEGSSSKFDFKYKNVVSRYDIKTTDGKVGAAAELADIIATFNSDVERDLYARETAKKLDINLDAYLNSVKKAVSKRNSLGKKEFVNKVIQQSEGYNDRINPDRLKNLAASNAEEAILGIFGIFPELIKKSLEGDINLTEDDFVTAFNKRVFNTMKEHSSDYDTVILNEEYNKDEISKIVSYSVARQSLTDNGIEVIAECTKRLRELKAKDSMSIDEILKNKRIKK